MNVFAGRMDKCIRARGGLISSYRLTLGTPTNISALCLLNS